MPAQRTTLTLDAKTRKAARELAAHYECSISEAVGRAVQGHRDSVLGIPGARRRERRKVLEKLFDLFESNDAREEIRRLKAEDVE